MRRSLSSSRVSIASYVLLASTLAIAIGIGVGVSAQSEAPATIEPTELTELIVGLGFIPSVQFAQFYLADEAGYYEEAGLDVTFQNKIDPELITLLAQGAVDIGIADGTSLIPAVSQGIPVVYGATIYGNFPNVVFAPAGMGIETVADLEGRSIGIPGRYGSSWVMLQALLASEGLAVDDVDVVTYSDFGQGVAVAQGQVDAATGFVNNEPVQLAREGVAVEILSVDDVAPLPGPGLAVGVETLETKGAALRAFTAATVRAMEDITVDPQLGLKATFTRVPELAGDPETQLAILEATIEAWNGAHALENGFGSVDRAAWESGLEIMTALPDSVVASPITVDQLITDALQPDR
jgi:NitT/TauT family transport system substrate-binding protein